MHRLQEFRAITLGGVVIVKSNRREVMIACKKIDPTMRIQQAVMGADGQVSWEDITFAD